MFLYLRKVQGQANRAPMVREILAGLEPQTRASDLLQTGVEPADLEIVETENYPKRAPVLRGALIVLFGLRRGCDSATCHHLNQMRAVLWAAMQVSDQVIRADSQTCDCDSREISSQRGLGFCPAVHTLV